MQLDRKPMCERFAERIRFATPDGPARSRGQALLEGVTELVGLTAAERAAMLVEMVEADVDRVEAQTLQAPPSSES